MEEITFQGLSSVAIQTTSCRVVIVIEIGPRIASFGKRTGRNLLFWDSPQQLKRKDWFLRGGHRIWVTRPDADETEEAYFPDNEHCSTQQLQSGIIVTGPVDARSGIQKSLQLSAVSDNQFEIVNKLRNCSDMLWSGGVWGLTATDPGTVSMYGIPLGDGSEWDVFTMVIPKKWGGTHTSQVNDPQILFTEKCLVLQPRGIESKRMIQAPQGVIGMTDSVERVTFLKTSSYEMRGLYPLNTNVAFYVAPENVMVEMEFMGPQAVLKPGEEMTLVERWELRDPIDWLQY